MVARYCMPKLLVLVAMAANLLCYTVIAFECSRRNILRMPIEPGTQRSQLLFATIDDQKAEVASSEESTPRRGFSFFGRRNSRTTLGEAVHSTKSKEAIESGPFEVTTVNELDDYFDDVRGRFRNEKNGRVNYSALLASLSVKGDTQLIGSPNHKDVMHPVVQLLHERKRQIDNIKSTASSSFTTATEATFRNKRNVHRTIPPNDGFRVALAVEGGGMRGCVTAGMVTAIHYLGLEDTIDVVYGSSAGTVIGAYFITRQLPWFGPELYYDALTMAGDKFINTKRFLRAVGLGLLDPRLTKDVRVRGVECDRLLSTCMLTTFVLSNIPGYLSSQ
jgi:hypothetical protein